MSAPKRTEEGWQQLVQHTLDMGRKIDRMQYQQNLMFNHMARLEQLLMDAGVIPPARDFMRHVNKSYPM